MSSIKKRVLESAPVVLFSLFSVVAVLRNEDPGPGGLYFALLPIVFTFNLIIFWRVFEEAKKNLPVLVFLIVSFMRYVFTPFLFSASSSRQLLLGMGVDETVLFWSFVLLAGDAFFSFFVAHICIGRYSVGESAIYPKQKASDSIGVLFAAVIILSLFVMANPSVLSDYRFFLTGSEQFHDFARSENTGVSAVALDLLMVLMPLLFVKIINILDGGRSKGYFFVMSLLIVLMFCLFIKGVSRFSLLVPTISWLVVLTVLYPKHAAAAKGIVGTFAVIALVFLTLYKNFRADSLSDFSTETSIEVLALMWNAYFANLFNFAVAVEVFFDSSLLERISYLLNDIMVNVALVSQYAEPSKTSVATYNFYIYGTPEIRDQIIPMTGQGLLHFGLFFPFAWIVLSVYLMVRFSFLLKFERNPGVVFILSYLSFYLAMSGMLSWNSVYPRFLNFALPLYIVFYLERRIRLGR